MKPFSKDSSNYQIGHLKQVERLSASQIAKHLNISKRHVEKVLEEETSYLCLFRLRIEYLGEAYQNNSAPISGWHRDVELGGDATFHQLNDIIQQVLGWDNSHLYAFAVKGNHYGYLGDDDFIVEDVFENYYSAKISLGASGLRKADTFVYEYDFGDRHLFLLTVLGSEKAHNITDLPRVTGLAGRDLIQYKTDDEEDAGQLFVSENPEKGKKINAKMVLLSQKTGSVREDMKKVDFIIDKDTRILEQ